MISDIRQRRGHDFAVTDSEEAPLVAIVNQTMADQYWPGQDAVGRRLFEGRPGEGNSYEVVGIVETDKYHSLGENPRPVVFRSRLQHPKARSTFVAHGRGDPQLALRRFVTSLAGSTRACRFHGFKHSS